MRRIGTIDIAPNGLWSIGIEDKFIPRGSFDLYIDDARTRYADEGAKLAAETLRASSVRARATLAELESPPPPWWRSFRRWRPW